MYSQLKFELRCILFTERLVGIVAKLNEAMYGHIQDKYLLQSSFDLHKAKAHL